MSHTHDELEVCWFCTQTCMLIAKVYPFYRIRHIVLRPDQIRKLV